MRKIIFFFLFALILSPGWSQVVNIPDPNFKTALLNHNPVIDLNGDGQIQVSEAALFTGYMNVSLKNISNITGLEAFVNMTMLNCSYNSFTSLPINSLTALREIDCSRGSISSLNISNLLSLQKFTCLNSPLTTLSFTNTPSLYEVACYQNMLSSLVFTNAPNLGKVNCWHNQLTTFTMTPVNTPIEIDCSVNRLTNLPLSSVPQLYNLSCGYNQLTSLPSGNLTNLITLTCEGNQLTSLSFPNPSGLFLLWCGYNQLTSLPSGMTSLRSLECSHNNIVTLPAGMNALLNLNISNNLVSALSVDNCNNLQNLNFTGNLVSSFSISNKPSLQFFECDSNRLSALSLSNLPALEYLRCISNRLPGLSLNNFSSLREIKCYNNLITSLQLTNLPALQSIFADSNHMTSLSLSGLPGLVSLHVNHNQLSSLSLSNLPSLVSLSCDNNQLVHLDLSSVPVRNLNFGYNPDLSYINIRNNSITGLLYQYTLQGLYSLQSICVDDAELLAVSRDINNYLPGQNISVSTLCTPTGNHNTITGVVRFDQDLNGCNNTDTTISFAKLIIADGPQQGITYTNQTGWYRFLTQNSPDTVKLSFPGNWLTVTPPSHIFSFSGYGNTGIADFCVSPANGTHPDLDITILPLRNAAPGRQADYKIIYKNKGNQLQSGTISLTYDKNRLIFQLASPSPVIQLPGTLQWNYGGLLPYETRTIDTRFLVAVPPAANTGDTLFFTAKINPIPGDETPDDNTFNLQQIVVNSQDPNDKLVLEGQEIRTDQLKNYLHYIVRFQNLGTGNAYRVVIRDTLTDKLDWSTFTPISTSHLCRISLLKNNSLEFIFDDINLPPASVNEPASNGFAAFKIKAKKDLIPGEIISNKASIYFDFNAAIVTNTATTTVFKPISSTTTGLIVYSNPTKDDLIFTIRTGQAIRSVNLYNTAGQLVNDRNLSTTALYGRMDVSNLPPGVYFLDVVTDTGRGTQKIVVIR